MICIGLGYGVMAAQDILVVFVLVRIRIAQPSQGRSPMADLPFTHIQQNEETSDRDLWLPNERGRQ